MSYISISDDIRTFPRTGVESPRKTVHEVCQASCGCRWCAAHAHRHIRNFNGTCKRLSQYVVKENNKKFMKSLGENFEKFSTSFSNLPLVVKLDELVQKEVTAYKQCSRQRCFKCRRYGHIAKDCEKVCKECNYFHQGKVCILNLIQNLQSILAYNYKNFITFYDKTVESINKLTKNNFNNLSVTSCPSVAIKPSYLVSVPTIVKHKTLVGRISEIQYVMNETFTKMIKCQMRDYAQQNNIALDKIELIRSEVPDIKSGITFDVDCRFKKYSMFERLKLGSRFCAKCEYDIFYHENQNIVCDDYAFGNVYRIEEKEELPPKPVFEMREKVYKMKNDKRDRIQLDRFNKMLRLYTTHDELEEKKESIRVAQLQLDKMRSDIENQCFDYVIAKEEYTNKMRALKEKFKQVKTNLINETRRYKEKNFKEMSNVKRQCIVEAKKAIKEKRNKIIENCAKVEANMSIDIKFNMAISAIKSILFHMRKEQWTDLHFLSASEPDRYVLHYRDTFTNKQGEKVTKFREATIPCCEQLQRDTHLGMVDKNKIVCWLQTKYDELTAMKQRQIKSKANEYVIEDIKKNRQCYDSESEDEE